MQKPQLLLNGNDTHCRHIVIDYLSYKPQGVQFKNHRFIQQRTATLTMFHLSKVRYFTGTFTHPTWERFAGVSVAWCCKLVTEAVLQLICPSGHTVSVAKLGVTSHSQQGETDLQETALCTVSWDDTSQFKTHLKQWIQISPECAAFYGNHIIVFADFLIGVFTSLTFTGCNQPLYQPSWVVKQTVNIPVGCFP